MAITRLDRLRKELDVAISSEDFDLAFQVVNDMIDIDPENAQFWNSKGVILSKMGRPEDALISFDRSLELDPEEAKTWYSKGCVLMDGGEYRLALACLYKTLDLDPEMQKARDRFNRCIDDWVASGTHIGRPDSEMEEAEEEIFITGQEKVIKPPEPVATEDETASSSAKEILKRKEVTGSFLDEDLFSEEDEGEEEDEPEEEEADAEETEEGEEEWSEGELEGWDEEEEEDEPEEEEVDVEAEDEGEEEWSEGELEGWDEEEEEDEPEEEMVPVKTIRCRCGADIPIYSHDRPYRFECPSCSRTGTLK